MLNVLLLLLCGAGELSTVSLGAWSSNSLQGKLQYPVWKSPSLVLMPGIEGGRATVEGMRGHDVGNLSVSLLASHPLDSAEGLVVALKAGDAAQDGCFGNEALHASLFAGWNRRTESSGYGFGMNVSNHSSGTKVTPIVSWTLRYASSVRFSGVLPALAELSWSPATAWRAGIREVAQGGDWRIDSARSLQVSQVSEDFFLRRRAGPVALDASLGWMVLNQVKYARTDRTAVTVLGYDVFSSLHTRSMPNRPGAVVRVSLLFPGGEKN